MPDDRDVGQVHSHRAHELETFLGALQDVAGRLDRVGLVVDQADELTIEVCQFLEKIHVVAVFAGVFVRGRT
ncbi:Uncharacterised protein [Mycobacterium tuberculosis]|uniref:Uncharacterized protein n=1 Tax=Mycobacterium tuberculosis TaxID=1773 RepID=A0A0U0SSH3_MYCTX|nr:hypothetical protein CAB90_04041 [Mycobacterium tuberculosis]CFE44356.1 Uncharacterised protein [Mycobacterium tuberculosis]CFE57554.1 Uncharacterised protein [Mycobacterium tuberculosis]CFS30711.1 Uncharacterised protein [Mycobacterium tuberculosis]CKO28162.1 Uncharacterised protein [Mycobacterium tuberculosis]